jgi:hypothetical protein
VTRCGHRPRDAIRVIGRSATIGLLQSIRTWRCYRLSPELKVQRCSSLSFSVLILPPEWAWVLRKQRMRRRDFVSVLCGLFAWPLASRAQHRRPWRIGMLDPGVRQLLVPSVTLALFASVADEITKLDQLKKSGSITEAEYARLRAKLV